MSVTIDRALPEIEQRPHYSVYLGNRMTNVPEFNFPWFAAAAEFLRVSEGWGVKNPAEKDLESIPHEVMVTIPGYETGDLALYTANSTFSMANAMEWDLPAILSSNGIVLGDGWPVSTGARWERTVAEALDRDIWLLHGEPGNFELEQDPNPKQLTQFLAGFGSPCTVRGHLDAVRKQIGHVPGIKAQLERIEANLA